MVLLRLYHTDMTKELAEEVTEKIKVEIPTNSLGTVEDGCCRRIWFQRPVMSPVSLSMLMADVHG
jgi:hypothetical protein